MVIRRCGNTNCKREAAHGFRCCAACRASFRRYRERNVAGRVAKTKAWKKAHPEQVNAHNRRYNAAHTEAARGWRQRWADAHPESPSNRQQTRRARKQDLFVEKVYKSKVLKLRGAVCGICGESVDPENFQLDHIVPLARGGEHSYANCQPAHGQNCRNSQGVACNQTKAVLLV